MEKRISLLTLTVLWTSMTVSSAYAGRETGNGGDLFALEFATIGRQVLSYVRGSKTDFPDVDADALEHAIAETKIVSVDKTMLDGVEKDALNYPSAGIIEINRSRWGQIAQDAQTKALVFHEYLGIMGVKDSDYRVSGRILRQLTTTLPAPQIDSEQQQVNCYQDDELAKVFRRTEILTDAIKRKDFSDSVIEYAQRAVNRCSDALKYLLPRDYGDLLHKAHLVFGHRALLDGNTESAKNELLLSCSQDGRGLDSFGPNMTLAKAFLDRGTSDIVIQFFDRCAEFWQDEATLLRWKSEVRTGKIPDFGPNLNY